MNNSPNERRDDPPRHAQGSLPLRGKPAPSPRTHQRIIIAHHLVLTGYGHWLPNDPRGSGSIETRKEELRDLGPIHPGRKRIQPPREELRAFYRKAKPLLEHDTIWFDYAKRQALADAFRRVIAEYNYTVWACAILRNHGHLVVRRHRDDANTIWDTFANYSRDLLRQQNVIPVEHPLWSERPYKVFLYTREDVVDRISYVNDNPGKEGLPPQHFDFVKEYDGWPHVDKR